jgi:lipid-A-disaccharide synthase
MEEFKKILIVAGEASGDLHAANLVKEIKNIYPQVQFFGLGGQRLKDQGVNLYFNIVELAVVGFFEVLKNLKKFKEIFGGLLKEVDRIKPNLAVLVDYPGFNLRLAKELKKRSIPVIYYISPQIWAWGADRIETIKETVNLMIVVLKFEEELYKKHNIPVFFVGHPLLDSVKFDMSKTEICNKLGLNLNNPILAILPGSREKEVKTLLPIMLDSAKLIHRKIPNAQFLILRSSSVKEEIFNSIGSTYKLPISIVSDFTYSGLAVSSFAMVASGTATLETAILGVPMVILYKVSFLTWLYLKMMIKIPYIGLVNLVRREKFIAEFVQYKTRPMTIADSILKTLKNKQKIDEIKQGLSCVTASLGEKGASQKAAKAIVSFINRIASEDENKSH